MGSLNSDSYLAMAWLIIDSIAAEFALVVIELSNVAWMISPEPFIVVAAITFESALVPLLP